MPLTLCDNICEDCFSRSFDLPLGSPIWAVAPPIYKLKYDCEQFIRPLTNKITYD